MRRTGNDRGGVRRASLGCGDWQQPRILFVDQSGEVGGAELSLLDIARHHRARCRVVLLQDGPFARRLEEAGVSSFVLPSAERVRAVRRDSGIVAAFGAAGALIRPVLDLVRLARSADLLYANTQKAFVLAALAGPLARRPVVWHLRDILSPAHFSRSNIRLAVALTRLARARVVANSEATALAFVTAGGNPRRVVTIPNGIDPQPWEEAGPDGQPDRARRELGLGTGPVVGLFGRLAPWKGQHVLLEALEHLPVVQALVVGGATFGEEVYRRELLAKADAPGLAGRVRFAGFRADVPALMRACDVVVHASTAPEPFGRVIVEAMLVGRPVVASDAGGPAEIIEHGCSGLLVRPGDPMELARALARVLGEPALARRLADAGRRRARAAFTLDAMLVRLDRFLAELPIAHPASAAGANGL